MTFHQPLLFDSSVQIKKNLVLLEFIHYRYANVNDEIDKARYSMLNSLHLFVSLYFPLFNYAFGNATVLKRTDLKIEDLIYVQAIWRHGDRAPHQLPYPNDLNDEKSWLRGWSQLTNTGMKQLYDLGLFFRKRYDGYIREFSPVNVRIVTSKSDRAIVSAQAMLRGLFPSENSLMQWLKGEQWQPIPFHTESIEMNAALLHPTLHHCLQYDQLVKNEMALIADTMMHKYANVVQLLENVTGIGEGIKFGQIATLIDIEREIAHQLPQPAWVYQKWKQFKDMRTIDIIEEFKRVSQILKYNTLEKAWLKGGLLLGDILHRFQNVSIGIGVEARKMFLYSAHDATILSLQYALNVGNGLLVPYSACLIIELYRTEKNETLVKILYKNETENADAHELFVPSCSIPCTLDQLIELSAPMIMNTLDDLQKICQGKKFSKSSYNSGNANNNVFNNDASQHNVTVIFSISAILIIFYILSTIFD
ncbi:Testicular acid phosphatase [Dirofilaria immitis]